MEISNTALSHHAARTPMQSWPHVSGFKVLSARRCVCGRCSAIVAAGTPNSCPPSSFSIAVVAMANIGNACNHISIIVLAHPLNPSAGAALLLLGDRPSGVTARRMGDSIFGSIAPLFGAACAASLAADVAAATGALPGGLAPGPCSWSLAAELCFDGSDVSYRSNRRMCEMSVQGGVTYRVRNRACNLVSVMRRLGP